MGGVLTARTSLKALFAAVVLLLLPMLTSAQTLAAPSTTETRATVSIVSEESAAAIQLAEALTDETIEEREEEIVTEVLTVEQLNEQLESVYIRPYSFIEQEDGTLSEVPVTTMDSGTYMLKKRVIVGLEPVSWLAQPIIEDHIEFSGVVEPNAVVTLVVQANPVVVEDTIADRRGRWSIALGVDELPAGEHKAYVQAATEEYHSDEIEVAEFFVEAREQVSNATWVMIIVIGMILIIVLVVVNVQFYINRRNLARYTPPAVAKADPDTHVEMDQEVIQSVSDASELSE